MLKKIFNSDSKYYLELPDEIEESKPVQAVVKTAEKVSNVVQEKATEVLESKPAQQAAETAKKTKDVAQDKLESANKTAKKTKDVAQDKLESANKTAKKTKDVAQDKLESASKTETKSNKEGEAKSNKEAQAKAKPSPKDAGASSFDPPFWVAAMYKNNSTDANSDGTQAEQTFATDNLMPIINKSRRRPGPSLNKFKDMASKTKTSR